MKKTLSFVIAMLPFWAFSQATQQVAGDAVIPSISAKLSNYKANHTIEKAYLQFDKPYYAVGDTIYFKAYLTLGAQHKLSALSGILYADLIDPNNKIARSIKLQVLAGTAHGDFALADTLTKGNYRVRAYTNWMRNNGPDSFFEQVIPVGIASAKRIPESGEPVAVKPAKKGALNRTDIQFLPEGGTLVAGNYSTVAFKAVAPNGLGLAIKGTLKDNEGNEVTTFATAHLGMGEFSFVPQAGKTYTANIIYANGLTQAIDLPKAVNSGYTINVNNANPDTISLRIAAGSESPQDKLNLVAQSGGIVYYAAESGPFSKFFTVVIPKSKFPTGVVQFTLFSQNGEPLNERLAFINNNNQLKLDVKAQETYNTRQKVNIEIDARGKDKKPVTGSFSVAVTDETAVPVDEQNETTILTNLLLTSDLKGTVEQPNYYFTNVTEKTQADLDLLMLTQGYRQFTWKQVLDDKPAPLVWQPEKLMQVSGRVIKWSKPAAGAKVSLVSNKGGFFMLDTVADKDGKFAFKDLIFEDSTKFVVQSRIKKGQDAVTVELDTVRPPQIPIRHLNDNNNLTFAPVADMSAYLINQKQFYDEQQKYGINKHAVLLKEVHVRASRDPQVPHSQNLNGAGNADQVLTAKQLKNLICVKLKDCLLGVIMSVQFARDGTPINMRERKAMAIVVDGDFVDPDVFDNINPDDIEGIEVILGPHYGAIYGTRAAGGILMITTKQARGTKDFYRYAPGVVAYHPKGFYKAREFYYPQYDDPKTNFRIGDYRSTICWKPDLITDKDGKTSFSFFNSDNKGTYRVVIEGIDADGNIGRQVYRYTVQ
ncbi:TonB-dependent receptor plug domain-containing protein [Mucilaginibacter flavidus]|uniref:TonB-dependent receptor plug domain-containing protein n=1 Tax=Mucilaginibacter flavidus TaxID=2949309 RepID=UPI0020938FA3|nr:TonB-dependent receptor plug domain-containing protein [Mucilaginibacter flavidus]MCO5946113.1 TonB-dependent receptor plug domain-containing protein [Mucilaginibacter flavidus]